MFKKAVNSTPLRSPLLTQKNVKMLVESGLFRAAKTGIVFGRFFGLNKSDGKHHLTGINVFTGEAAEKPSGPKGAN